MTSDSDCLKPILPLLVRLALLAIIVGAVVVSVLPTLYPQYVWVRDLLGVPVQLATIVALLVPLYSWKRQDLRDRQMRIEEVAAWPRYFNSMSLHYCDEKKDARGQKYFKVKDDIGMRTGEKDEVLKLARETAIKLAEAIGKNAGYLSSSSSMKVYELIYALQTWNAQDATSFREKLQEMRENCDDVQASLIQDEEQLRLSIEIAHSLKNYPRAIMHR